MNDDLRPPPELVVAVRRLKDFERTRIMCDNLMGALARRELGRTNNKDITDEDRVKLAMTLFGVDTPLHLFNPLLTDAEKREQKVVHDIIKASVFYPFVKRIGGLDTKTFGRFWAYAGDPVWDDHNDIERSIGMLFQYCGCGDPADKRRKGHKTRHNPEAKKRLFVIADGATHGNGTRQYRDYLKEIKSECYDTDIDDPKRKSIRHHTVPCEQCGTRSREKAEEQKLYDSMGMKVRVKNDIPAGIGDLWKPGHIHMHGLRMVKRAFLRDWVTFVEDKL